MTGEVIVAVVDEQGIDVDHVLLDLQVVRACAEFHQGPGDDVDETPGELAKRGAAAFAAELPGDPAGDLGDAPEAADGVVAGGDIRPAEVKDMEFLLASGATGFDIHALEQVGVALGVGRAEPPTGGSGRTGLSGLSQAVRRGIRLQGKVACSRRRSRRRACWNSGAGST